ncbi:hypothetical protein L798_02710 [Zootermopsis nevadensis]|uniref:Uncharacterized protein n=1 Tax=Zootermopsis nevadensis TaxID=136037 RepID=A0A067RPV8_ZOONE|nr:hypothetical protein L798_02710 [Zootermopsis nevadensis]
MEQDGVTSHTSRICMTVLSEMLPHRHNSRFGDIKWPARSPDHSVSVFFLWSHTKCKIKRTRPVNIDELKRRIQKSILGKRSKILRRVMTSLPSRLCVR